MKVFKVLFSLVVAVSLIGYCGCKKKPKPEAETTPAPEAAAAPAPSPAAPSAPVPKAGEKLPGEAAVRAALKKKDYATAITGLAALRPMARAPGGPWEEYRQLNADVGSTLAKAAQTDGNAAQALMTFQLMQGAR